MADAAQYNAPIAIGGLGGSGTRVFSALLRHSGVFMGDMLNDPLDNLWFSILFKQRRFVELGADSGEIDRAIRLFQTAMTQGLKGRLGDDDAAFLHRLKADLFPEGSWRIGPQSHLVDTLIDAPPPTRTPGQRWGWKEPNTHVFLPDLARRIDGLRFVLIVRDPLDMAFSRNTWQMQNWGPRFGVAADRDVPIPVRQLRYWTAAHDAALTFGAAKMPGRFLVMRYEDFCRHPDTQWHRLARFLGLPVADIPNGLLAPSGIGRSATHDLSCFAAADLSAANAINDRITAL